uniref:Ribonuclease P n=1 Tax=Angiostrongylus cantonensis TaxID=6313 RepID=A0A0K0DDT4_ANGCA
MPPRTTFFNARHVDDLEPRALLPISLSIEIYIHGLGSSLNRAMVLALEVQKTFTDAISLNLTTSTVNVTDDLFPLSDEFEMGIRNRPLSAIHIHIRRVQP